MKVKKILFIITIIAILFSNIAYAGSENTNNDMVSKDCAYTVALNFIFSNQSSVDTDIDGDLYLHGTMSVTSGYPKEVIIKEIDELVDEENNISAYLIKINDSKNNPSGYVIVSADKQSYPIIEYSYESLSFIDTATEKIIENEYENSKIRDTEATILYTGNYNYYLEFEDNVYSLQGGNYSRIQKAEIKKVNKSDEYKENSSYISAEWNVLTKELSGSSNPPIGRIITSPSSYESGYEDRRTDYCFEMGTTYYEMADFGYGAICTPTAGANLCLYWTRRVPSYSVLKKDDCWQETFNRLFDLMETSTTIGTIWPEPTRSAMKTYFRESGLTSTSVYTSICTSTTHFNDYIKAEINNGRPVLLALWDDILYYNHTVLGLGYERYKYNGVWSSHYIRINDGWSTGVDRYIHYETGRNSITRIRVNPGW